MASDEKKEKKSWDEIDEAAWESFPASDPPSWTSTTTQRSPCREGEDHAERRAETPAKAVPRRQERKKE